MPNKFECTECYNQFFGYIDENGDFPPCPKCGAVKVLILLQN